MPFKFHPKGRRHIPRQRHRITNWREYDAYLGNRASLQRLHATRSPEASAERVYDHWALDIRDCDYRGEREVGFIPRPRRFLSERLLADPSPSARHAFR